MSHEEKENMCENKNAETDTLSDKSRAADEMPEQSAREIQVHYGDAPVPQRNREIHPRQIIPPIPDAEEIESDYTPSPPVEID